MTALVRVGKLLAQCATDARHMPPTALYNEGWMLRLILDWCAENPTAVEPFVFLPGSRWYSEALLPSRFGGRGGPREGFTHADGVIGHFQFRPKGRGDIELVPGARQLSVVEAKMGSLLSSGTSNAVSYNQAARNVACMAHMIAVTGAVETLDRLSFTVIAPEKRITERAFEMHLTTASLLDTVRSRSLMFGSTHEEWFSGHFTSLMSRVRVEAVSWEQVIAAIGVFDPSTGDAFTEFLELCLKYNPMSPHKPRRGATSVALAP